MSLRPHPLETLLTALAGWLPVLGGMVLLGMTVITPEWLGWRELVWQRDMVALQAEGLETQRASYAEFHDALTADDPVLLERLAFTQLRYKPVNKRLLDGVGAGFGEGGVVTVGNGFGNGVVGMTGTPGAGAIEAWLAVPQPVVGQDIEPLREINTRLTRLTGGASRYVLLAVAMLCLVAGLWPEKAADRCVDEIIE